MLDAINEHMMTILSFSKTCTSASCIQNCPTAAVQTLNFLFPELWTHNCPEFNSSDYPHKKLSCYYSDAHSNWRAWPQLPT